MARRLSVGRTVSDQAAAVEAFKESIANVPLAMAILDPVSHRYIATNKQFDKLLAGPNRTLRGERFETLLRPEDREHVVEDYEQLVAGRFDGYQARRQLVTPAGQVSGQVWIRRIALAEDATLTTIIFIPDEEKDVPPARTLILGEQLSDVAFVVTDHEWVIEYASREIEELIGTNESVIGKPLLGTVRPDVAAEFLASVTLAAGTKRSVVTQVQMRAGSGWRHFIVLIAPLCEHTPPRLGLVVAAIDTAKEGADPRTRKLEQHMWRIASEVLASPLLRTSTGFAKGGQAGRFAELTPQQWEITMRLLNGERVPQIAKGLHLSQSTVRNHLSAVFNRFDVHSQAELISKLKELNEENA